MKHSTILLIFFLFALGVTQKSYAQSSEVVRAQFQENEDQRRLSNADSIHRVHENRAVETNQRLKIAKDELKRAQQNFEEARQVHKQQSDAAKEAKQAYNMEVKVQKARKKAEDQATKANSAAINSNHN